MKKEYTSIEQLPLTLNARQLAIALGISRAHAYNLLHSKGFPTVTIGRRLVVTKGKLLEWLEKQAAE